MEYIRIRNMIKSSHPGDVEIALRFLGATSFKKIKELFPNEGKVHRSITRKEHVVDLHCDIKHIPHLKFHNALYARIYTNFIIFECLPMKEVTYVSVKDII